MIFQEKRFRVKSRRILTKKERLYFYKLDVGVLRTITRKARSPPRLWLFASLFRISCVQGVVSLIGKSRLGSFTWGESVRLGCLVVLLFW